MGRDMIDVEKSELLQHHNDNLREAEALAKQDIEQRKRLDDARNAAIEILKHGDPRAFILNTFKTQHIGDNETAEGILIGTANQSIANSKGIQSAVYGESGTGKSHAARAMLHLFPDQYYMTASLSDKALFYLEAGELRAGTTIFSDDVKISDGVEGVIKRATTAFQEYTIHKVAAKEGGRWRTKELKIAPRINWLLTSVDSQGSEQLINRQIGFGVDESAAQDDKVTAFELAKAREGLPEFNETDDVLICREIILNLKQDETGAERLFTVKIPFANRIEWLDKKNRRNLPIFLDMIKGYAALNFKQRKSDDEGAIIATEADFKAAERLYNTRGGFQKLHINEREKEMLQHIVENGGELATGDLMDKLKLSGMRVRQIAARLETVLPGFYVEKRSESVQDASDTGKHTVTQRNYYCYNGAVTVDLFGSVVSLRPDSADNDTNHLKSISIADKYQLNNHLNPDVVTLENAHSDDFTVKEANNNNIINNNNNYKGSLKEDSREDIRARVCSSDACLSATGKTGTNADINANLPLDDAGDLSQNFNSSLSGVKAVDQRELAQFFITILKQLAGASGKKKVDKDTLISGMSMEIKHAHPEINEDDLYSFGKRLIQDNKEAQALIAEYYARK